MSDKVVSLNGQPVPEPDYNTSVVDLLERCIADVKANKANSIIIGTIIPTEEGWDAECYWHGRRLTLLSAAARLQHRLNQQCDEETIVIS